MTEPIELQKMYRVLHLMAILRSRPQTFQQIQEILADDNAGSRSSVYRYFTLFKQLNLNLEKKGKTYFISDTKTEHFLLSHDFTTEEIALIRQSLLQTAPDTPLQKSIFKKLAVVPDFVPLVDSIIQQQIIYNINQLDKAIQAGVCVALKNRSDTECMLPN